MNTSRLVSLLVTYLAYIDCASIVGHGTDVLGHVVPVKCTMNCETQGPSVGPVVPHLPHPAGPIIPKSSPPASPAVQVPSDPPAPKEVEKTVSAPSEPSETSAHVVDTASTNQALYHKGLYAGLGQSVHPYWGHLGAWGHHGAWGNHAVLQPHGLWGQHGVLSQHDGVAHPVVPHVDYSPHALGGYATGPIDVHSDGSSYTGSEDDRSPIAGGPVSHSLVGVTKWHGPYHGPVAHVPTGGYGTHHVLPHHSLGQIVHSDVAHPGIVTGGSVSGIVTHHGPAVGLRAHLPASTHFGVVNTHNLVHRKLGDYTIGDMKDLTKEDCPPGLSAVLFDKSAKSADAEAAPVADSAQEAGPAKA